MSVLDRLRKQELILRNLCFEIYAIHFLIECYKKLRISSTIEITLFMKDLCSYGNSSDLNLAIIIITLHAINIYSL